MKKLFLHIGSHKTGTSSIQEACILNKKMIQERGFDFFDKGPDGSKIRSGNASIWIPGGKDTHDRIYRGEGLYVKDLEKLVGEINKSRFNNIIVSAENFSWIFDEEHLKKLSEELNKFFDVKIIFYIRRQDKFLVSHHQQSSKSINIPSYAYYKGGCLSLPYMRNNYDEYLNYNKKIYKWEKAFGNDSLIVKKFERSYLKNADIFFDFLSTIGVSIDGLETTVVNESNGFQRSKIGHLLNISKLEGYLNFLIRECADNKGKMLPSRQQAKELYELYKPSNIELNRRLNISDELDDIFGEDFSDYPDEQADLWGEDSANEAFINIFNALSHIDFDVDLLRDSAVALESIDLNKSYKLMMMAYKFRPNGGVIKNKLEEYKERLSQKNN